MRCCLSLALLGRLRPRSRWWDRQLEFEWRPVSVTSSILVSSADPIGQSVPPPPRRRSNSGGKINLQSGAVGTVALPSVAINVTNTSALLSLLDSASTGPGGKITILATGANSSVNVSGPVEFAGPPPTTILADGGTVDIRHTGDNGLINVSNVNMRADVVKIGALGNNGVLNIGGGTITANTILKLYATGSNGAINFIADATLTGASIKTIAASTVTVFDNVVVTIGGAKPADVYTSTPNYSMGNGGNGSTTGQFTLSGGGGSGVVTHIGPIPTPPPFDTAAGH